MRRGATVFALLLWWACAAFAADVEFDIQGNQALTQPRLLSEISFWVDDIRMQPESDSVIEDAAYALQGIFEQIGYEEAGVKWRRRVRRNGNWRVTFLVEEGPLSVVETLELVGAEDSDALSKAFVFERAGLLPGSPQVFSESALRAGVDGVRLILRLSGYQSATVTSDVKKALSPDGTRQLVTIMVTIERGPRFTIGDLRIQGVDAPLEARLREAAAVAAGQPYTARVPVEVASRMSALLRDDGYYFADVDVDPQPSDAQQYHLRASVAQGQRVRIAKIKLKGHSKTRTGFILDRLPFTVGDYARKSTLDAGRRQLLRTTLFRRVRFVVEAFPQDQEWVELTVELEEKDDIRFSVQFGFGTYELGRVKTEILHKNLLGLGLEGRASAKASFRGENTELRLRYPFLLNDRLAVNAGVGYERFEEVTFTSQEVRYKGSFDYDWSTTTLLSTGYELTDGRILDADDALDPELTADTTTGLLFWEGRRDTRDSFMFPTKGQLQSLRLEYAGPELGSEITFYRVTGRLVQVWPLSERVQLVAALQAGYILPSGENEIPLNERFLLGGSRTVRSFQEDRLGPTDGNNDPIGGEAYVVGNIELRYPIWRQLLGALFFDTGSLVDDHNDIGRRDYRHGLGTSLMLNTPIGPIRVGGAWNINRGSKESSGAIHVLIGHPF